MRTITLKLSAEQLHNLTNLDLKYLQLKAELSLGRAIRRPDNLKIPTWVNQGGKNDISKRPANRYR